jgi:tRNA (cytidine/uridine-2'-O-)-methyltransferase
MTLHLIEPLGFKLDTKYVKRSAANYLEHVQYYVYKDWDDFASQNQGQYYFMTRYGQKSPDQMDYVTEENVYLIFGSESSGIPKRILTPHIERCLRLPMTDKVRSLNLSNTVAIVAYEVLRQQGYEGLYSHEPDSMKGKDYLLQPGDHHE